jgi:hypothetical protein
MKRLRGIFGSLLRPLGASADGRLLGTGLSTALVRAEQGLPDEVEDYLRTQADARNISS